MSIGRCRLCGLQLSEPFTSTSNEVRRANCIRCGNYEMTSEVYEELPSLVGGDLQSWLRAATRQHWEITSKPLRLTTQNVRSLATEHAATSVAENVSKLLNYFVRHSPRPARQIAIEQANDYTIIDAQDEGELFFYLRHLEESGLIKSAGPKYQLTYKGWDHVLGTSATSAEIGRVFVATWFHPTMDEAYRDGISPALVEAGYQPVWMNSVFMNDDINFRILIEIRKAHFIVADVTGHRGGVYFEAGFAKGLGREVFFTCKEDRFLEDKHFDTEHFQHTNWKTPSDLKGKLYEKIFAIMGAGPYLTRV